MSDSLAGLSINVNVRQVQEAVKALEGLAATAEKVEKKVSNVNVGTTRTTNNRIVQEATRVAKEIEKVNREQNAARKISAEQTISIERAKMNTLIADNNRFFSAMNLAENRRLVNWQKFQDRLNRGIDQEIAANKRKTDAIAAEGQRQIAATEAITRRAEAARERAMRQVTRERDREVRNAQAQARQTLAQEVALERALQSARSRVTGITGRANRQLPNVEAASIIRNATDALRVYEGVLRSSGAGSLAAIRAQGDFARAMQSASGEIARQGGLLRTLNNNASAMNAAFGGASNTLGGFGRVVFQTNAALASLAGAFALREITQSIMEFERFSNTLRTVSGSSGEFGQNMTFLFNEANRIGFSIGEVGNSFARFSLAMQGAGFNSEQTRSSFSQLAKASRNLGLSSADTTGVIRALEQSMSKGKFMAEEVRLQLGDRLPFAMAALTRAVTTVDGKVSDINKRFEEGTLDVARYGEEFIRQLNAMSGGADALSRTSNTIAAAFGRLGTEFTKTTTYFGEAGFSNAVIIFANNLQRILELSRESGVLDILADGLLKVAQNMEVLAVALGTVGALLSARLIQVLFTSISQLNPAVRGLTLAVGGLTAAYQVLSGLNNNSATSAQNFAASMANLNTITGRVNESVQNYQNLINRGAPLTDASATAVDQHVAANMRLGDSFEVAARKAGEAYAEINRLAAEQARREQEAAERNLRGFLAGQPAFQNFGRASRIREAEARSGFRLQPGQETVNPGLTVAQDTFVNNAIQDFVNLRKSFEETVASIRAEFGQNVPASVQTLLQSLARLEGNNAFQQMLSQVTATRQQIQGLTIQLRSLSQDENAIMIYRANFASLGVDRVRGSGPQSLSEIDTGTAVNLRGAASPRTRLAALRTVLTSGPLASNFSGLNLEGRDTEVLQRIANDPRVRSLLPESLRALSEGTPTSRTSAGGANRVEEAMRDLRLQSGRAGIEGGTAANAYAEAINRVADAANEEAEAFGRSAKAAEVRELVAKRLNEEMELAIRLMARETANNNRVAQAYAQSNAAGRRMEITIRAEAEARKYAIENNVEYARALQIVTEALDANITSEQNAAAARQLREGRNEIEVLELEGRLITANVAARNAEVAVLRARQQFAGADEAFLNNLEQQIRRTEELRSQNEQLTNSWTEVSRLGEQAFERIGSAITEAFAQGRVEGINFKNVMKAVFSEVAQAALKLAVINPILNAAFGGTRGTLSGAFSAINAGSNGDGAASIVDSGGNIIGQLSGISNARTINSVLSGNMGSFFPGGAAVNTGLGFVDSALNTSLVGTGTLTPTGFVGAGGVPIVSGTSGLSVAQALGPAASIAGGAYGIYSGIQRGGVGGYTSALGGAASVGGGLAMLGLLGPGLAALGPAGIAAGAILAIAGALLPGEKPSTQGQLSRVNLNSGLKSFEGLGGRRFSQGNRDVASNTVDSIVNVVKEIGDKLGGARIGGNVAVGVTNDKLYLEVVRQKADFANTEEGAQQLAETAARMVFNEFKGQGSVAAPYRGILDASNTLDELSANIQWYEEVYKAFEETGSAANRTAEAVKAVENQFNPLIDKAHQLGLASDNLVKARQKEIDAIYEANTAVLRNIDRSNVVRNYRAWGLDNEADLFEFEINATEEIKNLKKTLEDMGFAAEMVALKVMETENTLGYERVALQKRIADEQLEVQRQLAEEQAQLLNQARSASANSISSLAAFARTLSFGDASTLNAQSQYDLAYSNFANVSNLALRGDARGISQLQSASEQLLSSGRDMFGSGAGYAYLFDQVLNTVQGVANVDENTLTASSMAQIQETSTVTLQTELQALRQEVVNLRNQVATNQNTPARAM